MLIGVLGPIQVLRDDAAVELGTPKQRMLLTGLALTPNQVVTADALAELLWRSSPPTAVQASLHGYVAALRRVLEPARAARGRPEVLLTSSRGYELRVPVEAVDAWRFVSAVESAHRRLGGGDALTVPEGMPAADLEEAVHELDTALVLWRGTPYAELPDSASATAERGHLEELRLVALQDRARMQLALGRHAAVAAELGSWAQAHPLREDLWGLHALALVRSGRQADALEVLRSARASLDEELGIEPGPGLRDLEVAILRQDLSLQRRTARAAPAADLDADRSSGAPVIRRTTVLDARLPPVVGRDREVQVLEELVERAAAGLPQVAVLVGEPGIGKTRLIHELTLRTSARGTAVLLGRCSPEEGAPPLWPWVGVLRSLAEALPEVDLAEVDGADGVLTSPGPSAEARFRLFEAVARVLVRAASHRPLLVVFDDLHWADASSARLLRHLVDTVERGRITFLLARRPVPEPTGAAAELGEALARRGAVRLDLAGLGQDDVMTLAEAVTGVPAEGGEAAALRDRTEGNPFFLVELLRLGRGDGAWQLPEGAVPAAVGDVIAARLAQLPDECRHLLRLAAVLGGDVDIDLLARLAGRRVEEVLDGLEPAIAAGMVADSGNGTLQFSHALVRDAVYSSIPSLRRRQWHADVAALLTAADVPASRLAEIARHWLRAGPSGRARAWRAAAEAAAYATGLQAPDEAAELLAAAIASQRDDPAASWVQRYDLLMARARACRAAADSDGQRAATAEALRQAQDADDLERLALAAITGSEGALWSNRPQGQVDEATVAALHRIVRELPGGDTGLRCRAFLALSRELFWAALPEEREAHAERGLAMARRLDDPRLRAWACHTAIVSAFRPDTLEGRCRLADEAIGCSRASGDEEGEATGLFWRAVAAGEAGRITERRAAVEEALALAGRGRLRYLQVMIGTYEVAWLAVEGRFAEGEELYEETLRRGAHAAFPFHDEAVAAARLCLDLWQGRGDDLLPRLMAIDASSPVDIGTAILLLLVRTGRLVEAADHLDRRPLPLTDGTFDAPLCLALAAETAFLLSRPELAATVYARLAPWSGRMVSGGTSVPLGPVDAFLALAAAAVGETRLATEHARRALELCAEWHLAPVARWLEEHRVRGGF